MSTYRILMTAAVVVIVGVAIWFFYPALTGQAAAPQGTTQLNK
jgi:hypothetical protein